MWYFIHARDNPDSLGKRLAARSAHLARLEALLSEGRLLTGGPLPAIDSGDPGEAGFTGSMIVVAFDSLADVQAWADADPYIEAGVYAEVNIYPYKPVLP